MPEAKTTNSDAYAGRPCHGELAAVFAAGTVHIIVELALSEPVAMAYNAAVSILFLGYLVWRARRSAGALRAWGMRSDNFLPALRAQLGFGSAGVIALVAYGAVIGSLSLPGAFWMTLVLYPVWGIAQQFALQNLIARNLAGMLSSRLAIAAVASVMFSVSHYPRYELMILTLVAGVFFTLAFRRYPNLWAVGIVHGLLGSLAVYIVLKEDPGAAILEFLLGN